MHSIVDAVGEQLRHLVVGRISAAPFGDVVDTLLQEHLPPLRCTLLSFDTVRFNEVHLQLNRHDVHRYRRIGYWRIVSA